MTHILIVIFCILLLIDMVLTSVVQCKFSITKSTQPRRKLIASAAVVHGFPWLNTTRRRNYYTHRLLEYSFNLHNDDANIIIILIVIGVRVRS